MTENTQGILTVSTDEPGEADEQRQSIRCMAKLTMTEARTCVESFLRARNRRAEARGRLGLGQDREAERELAGEDPGLASQLVRGKQI